MLASWIYGNPLWLTSSVILGAAVGLSVLSLLAVRGVVSHELRLQHNDMTGFTIANISVVYAVLLAFIAVATWDSFEKANTLVGTEANLIGRIARDAAGLGAEHGNLLRRDLRDYAVGVVEQEWPAQQEGKVSDAAAPALDAVQSDVVTFLPRSSHDSVVMQEVFHSVNELYAARRDRLEAAAGHVPKVVWWVIVAGGAITIGYTLLFGVRSLAVHIAMTVAFTIALSLVAILIVQLDYPFRGPVSASPDPYLTVLDELRHASTASREAHTGGRKAINGAGFAATPGWARDKKDGGKPARAAPEIAGFRREPPAMFPAGSSGMQGVRIL